MTFLGVLLTTNTTFMKRLTIHEIPTNNLPSEK